MLEFGATSWWEMWDRHTSLCHGWSAAPAMILPAYVAGIKPIKPGFATFQVKPYIPSFQWLEAAVPTPHGIIGVSWQTKQNQVILTIDVPKGIKGEFIVPAGFSAGKKKKILLENGHHKLVLRMSKKGKNDKQAKGKEYTSL
ncbi:MAG TPA: alpha-L-rhamnosidase C-terminal domain-containing protein, partial [bacterium]|nr:alpha-L-rhamnosidase C-terminal domain-containing protein [bacterium]